MGNFTGVALRPGLARRSLRQEKRGKRLNQLPISRMAKPAGMLFNRLHGLCAVGKAHIMTTTPRSLPFLFIALAGFSLLLALWSGVVRLGWPLPLPNFLVISLHGPLMVIGFLTTLIGLERAAAVDRWWVYGVPLLALFSILTLLFGLPQQLTGGACAGAALLLTLFFVELYRRQPEAHFVVMALSAATLCCGNLLWLAELPVHRVAPWWVAFLVLMIAGERLELNRLRSPTHFVRVLFGGAVVIFVVGLVISAIELRLGVRIAGAGLLGLALWLLRYDLAWQNLQQARLPRFMASCLIAGYFWLAIGGLLWILFARFFGAGPLYDAMLHAIFLGFVFSMIFAHAPIILPSITDLALPFHKLFYLHAALLHLSLLLRIAGDLALIPSGQKWGGILNALSILVFLFNNIRAVKSARSG